MADTDEQPRARAPMFTELALPVALIGLSLYLWTLADRFTGGAKRYEAIGPDFFPKLLLAMMIALCTAQVVSSVIGRSRTSGGGEALPVYWADLAIAVGATAAYVAILPRMGFLLATPLFQFALLFFVFRVRQLRVLLVAPPALTIGLALLFVGVMNAPLPRGRGFFGAFSHLFY